MAKKKGYSKEKADKMIKDHKEEVKKLKEEEGYTSGVNKHWDKEGSEERKKKINKHEQSIENLKELKKHWGDD